MLVHLWMPIEVSFTGIPILRSCLAYRKSASKLSFCNCCIVLASPVTEREGSNLTKRCLLNKGCEKIGAKWCLD